MSNLLYKIVHLGTPDAQTGLTQIAEGFKEIFEKGADTVYIQSAEISRLFAETRRIMALMPANLENDLNQNDDLEQHLKSIFSFSKDHQSSVNSLDPNSLKPSDTANYFELFNKLAKMFINTGLRTESSLAFIRHPEEKEFLHSHDSPVTNHSNGSATVPKICADFVFVTSIDPNITTRIATSLEGLERGDSYNYDDWITTDLPTESVPRDALIILRNGGDRENPWHGTAKYDGHRFSVVASLTPNN